MARDADENDASRRDAAARKRGLKGIAIAILLLLLALVLLLALQPKPGAHYSMVARVIIQVIAGGGYATLLHGLFRSIVGAGVGALAPVLEAVAVTIVVGGILAGILAGWLVHGLVSEPWTSSARAHHHHDWD